MPSSSLKDVNRRPLYGLVILNTVVLLAVLHGESLLSGGIGEVAKTLSILIPVCVGAALVGLLNAQASATHKARLVFLRWHHPLPGARAFSKYVHDDPRINVEHLQQVFGPFPSDPAQQNALWFKLFKSVEDDPSVRHVHREFLLARDYAFLSLLMFFVFGTVALHFGYPLRAMTAYSALLAIQFLIARRAAGVHGDRLVTTVLALKSAGK